MMTGLAGMAMWLMMGLMLIGLAAGALTWTRHRLHRHARRQPSSADETPEQTSRRLDE
jgi:F0F1-type ATP synthase assembly protein I